MQTDDLAAVNYVSAETIAGLALRLRYSREGRGEAAEVHSGVGGDRDRAGRPYRPNRLGR